METINTTGDVLRGLAELLEIDPALKPLAREAGTLPLRREEPGFGALARIITAQLVSQASADAIYGRFCSEIPARSPHEWLSADPAAIRRIGLTRAKEAALTGLAQGIISGQLDLDALGKLPAEEAIGKLVTYRGIGRWTAEIYMLFCCGHPDIFPAGDLALRNAVSRGLALDEKADEKTVRQIAKRWKPLRGIAARLFWAYYKL